MSIIWRYIFKNSIVKISKVRKIENGVIVRLKTYFQENVWMILDIHMAKMTLSTNIDIISSRNNKTNLKIYLLMK